MKTLPPRLLSLSSLALALAACANTPKAVDAPVAEAAPREYIGTHEPFVSEAVYFVVTDRFVNGDPDNDQREQGGENRSFDIPVAGGPAGRKANVGYLGGDFKGILDNAGYIRDLGFTAVWLTPIVDNPDEAFTGGEEITWGASLKDKGKSGYHGYWGVNFFELDEHLPSPGLGFRELTAGLKDHGLKTVLDIVTNHGSPAYTMPVDQPKFGEIYGRDGTLLADHQNLHPTELDPEGNPLHRWFIPEPELVQLPNLDWRRPEVLDYFVDAYLHWIEQGADAFRIDTIGWVDHAFWKAFADRIRERHPGYFMFAEHFSFDAAKIAEHTHPQNGAISVLDFPLQSAMSRAFGRKDEGFEVIAEALFLEDGPYANPYDLALFYDNHDMPRLDANDQGFIDAHHFLFTARGFPVVYYGSETGFERGAAEHAGNRNYFGQVRVDTAPAHPIHANLKRIAHLRKETPALQRGLMIPLEFAGDRAAFLRVLQTADTQQTALVLLNKGEGEERFVPTAMIDDGTWVDALGGGSFEVAAGGGIEAAVPAHSVRVFLREGAINDSGLISALERAMGNKRGRP
jgi:cyclomaltodextrin glucanotransferase